MITDALRYVFTRDIDKLKTEIASYTNEDALWEVSGAISNSGGNLCLHLIGNLNHFFGAILGSSGYVRQRDLEFSQKNIPVKQLVNEVESTARVVDLVLSSLTQEQLEETFPVNVLGEEMSTLQFILHLSTHLNYHLGQLNYHRRFLVK